MIFLDYAKYAAIGLLGFIVAGEIYHHIIQKLKEKLQAKRKDDEILEIIFCRDEMTCGLATGISFNKELESTHTQELLENLIMSAQKTIQIAMYIFTNKTLGEALINAHARGVKVSVVVDHSMENSKGSKIHDLHNRGIPIRVFREGTMHLKLCLIDVPYDTKVKKLVYSTTPTQSEFTPICLPPNGITITGSLNWTREALLNNEENFIVSSNKQLCECSATKFYKIWNSSTLLYEN